MEKKNLAAELNKIAEEFKVRLQRGARLDKTVATAIEPCAVLVNVPNYIIPRMKGVSLETEYQVGNQRTAIVASQSVGFEELFAGDAATVGLPVSMMKYANG